MLYYRSRTNVAKELGIGYMTFYRHEARGLIPPPRVVIGLGASKITVPGWLPGDAAAYRSGTLEQYETVFYASKIELAPLFGISQSTLQTISHPPSILVNTRAGWSYPDILAIASDRGWGVTDIDQAKKAGQSAHIPWGNSPWPFDYVANRAHNNNKLRAAPGSR